MLQAEPPEAAVAEAAWLVTHLDLEQPVGKVGIEGIPLLHGQTLQGQDCFNHQHVRDSIAHSLPTGREKHCSREAGFEQEASRSQTGAHNQANPANTVMQLSRFLPD